EIAWRKAQGRSTGFETLLKTKPLVAVGPDHPLNDDMLMADFFHGRDGLGDIHGTHPHMTPDETWKTLFDTDGKSKDPVMATIADELPKHQSLFETSKVPAHKEILRLLRENDAGTISIVAIGPLTNL
ncbi:hypothetical protein LTR53_018759, partial [Teratosphaeriaceae sp. CCFEE 6253]